MRFGLSTNDMIGVDNPLKLIHKQLVQLSARTSKTLYLYFLINPSGKKSNIMLDPQFFYKFVHLFKNFERTDENAFLDLRITVLDQISAKIVPGLMLLFRNIKYDNS